MKERSTKQEMCECQTPPYEMRHPYILLNGSTKPSSYKVVVCVVLCCVVWGGVGLDLLSLFSHKCVSILYLISTKSFKLNSQFTRTLSSIVV